MSYLPHALYRRMTDEERAWLKAFDLWHERGERNDVARQAGPEARRIVDAQCWAARQDVTRRLQRVDLPDTFGEPPSGAHRPERRSIVVEALSRRLRELTPGSGRRKPSPPCSEARAIRVILEQIGRLS